MARLNPLRLAWQAQLPDHTIGVARSPDGKQLAAAAVSGPIAIFEAIRGKALYQLDYRRPHAPREDHHAERDDYDG